ncbi:MAG: hypothetical protein C4533_07030 [Candidatus Omnitrophota bacterium]|jgi:hypothetical protein|nr:MAG: hypothetical protein C4533_07030 [Candidatus Omnitrophota bacterium]
MGKKKNILFFSAVLILGLTADAFAQENVLNLDLGSMLKLPKEYAATNLRDPFEKRYKQEEQRAEEGASGEAVNLPELKVQGLIWGSELPQAIINNKVVKVGDTISGVEILEINDKGITVLFDYIKYDLPAPASAYVTALTEAQTQTKGGHNEER